MAKLNLGKKTLQLRKKIGQQIIGMINFLVPKKFVQKVFGPKKNISQKNFGPNDFGQKNGVQISLADLFWHESSS